jgi:hypothetical protein
MAADRFDQLLLAALAREAKPANSDTLLDLAMGLALSHGWTAAQTANLTRRIVAARLQLLEKAALVRKAGTGYDDRARRTTPAYLVTDTAAGTTPPPPPYTEEIPGMRVATGRARLEIDSMSRDQVTTLLDGQDLLIECVTRFLADLSTTRAKVRQRLAAAGLGEHG